MISVSSVCTSKFHIFFSRSPREWGHLINVSVLRYLSKFCASLCFCNQPPPPSPALNALRTNEKPFRQYLLFFAVFFWSTTLDDRPLVGALFRKWVKRIQEYQKIFERVLSHFPPVTYCPMSYLSNWGESDFYTHRRL